MQVFAAIGFRKCWKNKHKRMEIAPYPYRFLTFFCYNFLTDTLFFTDVTIWIIKPVNSRCTDHYTIYYFRYHIFLDILIYWIWSGGPNSHFYFRSGCDLNLIPILKILIIVFCNINSLSPWRRFQGVTVYNFWANNYIRRQFKNVLSQLKYSDNKLYCIEQHFIA